MTKTIIEQMADHSETHEFAMLKIRAHINSLPNIHEGSGIIEEIEKGHKIYPTTTSSSDLVKYMEDYIKSCK